MQATPTPRSYLKFMEKFLDFSPWLRDKIWEWPGNEATGTQVFIPGLPQWRSQTRAQPGLGPCVSIRKTVEHRTFVV